MPHNLELNWKNKNYNQEKVGLIGEQFKGWQKEKNDLTPHQLASRASFYVWIRGTVTRFEFAPLLMYKRYAQCRGTDSVLRTLAHLLAAHPTATPKQAKEPIISAEPTSHRRQSRISKRIIKFRTIKLKWYYEKLFIDTIFISNYRFVFPRRFSRFKSKRKR